MVRSQKRDLGLRRERKIEMKALVYNGPKDVALKDVPDAKIEKASDALVEITSTNICGSDLHMYEGRSGRKLSQQGNQVHLPL